MAYDDFVSIVMFAPNLKNLSIYVLDGIHNFDQADFVSRIKASRKWRPKPLGRLEHFMVSMLPNNYVADERVPLAILEAAGESLKSMGNFRRWCRLSTAEAKVRLVARAKQFGLIEVKNNGIHFDEDPIVF